MRTLWVWLATGLFAFGALQAEYRPPIFDFGIGVGYRHDNFRMEVDGFIPNPTTNFSKSTRELWRMYWRDIEIVESSAVMRYTSCLNYYLRLTADWGRIHNGNGHLNGYALKPPGDIGPIEESSSHNIEKHFTHFSRIKGKTDKGCVGDFSGCVGYQFRSNGRRCIITPLIGWSYHYQQLEFHHAKQQLNTFDFFPILGPIPDLHFDYKPRWYGPFIGADIEVQVDIPCVLLFGTIEYHWAQFKTTAEWNFANAFVNEFKQHSHSHGVIVAGGMSLKLECNLWITAFATWRNWQVEEGKHRTTDFKNDLLFPDLTFGTFPVFDPKKSAHLREFKWNSWTAGLAFDYRF